MGVDPTPAPLGDVSIGAAIETYTGSKFGSSGTMTAALHHHHGGQSRSGQADRILRPHGSGFGR